MQGHRGTKLLGKTSGVIDHLFSIEDTSSSDRRLHAVRRTAIAAFALGKDVTAIETYALSHARGIADRPAVRSVLELSDAELETIASSLEEDLDSRTAVLANGGF